MQSPQPIVHQKVNIPRDCCPDYLKLDASTLPCGIVRMISSSCRFLATGTSRIPSSFLAWALVSDRVSP